MDEMSYKLIKDFMNETGEHYYSLTLNNYNILIKIIEKLLPEDKKAFIISLDRCHQDIVRISEKKSYEKGFKDGEKITAFKYKEKIASAIEYRNSVKNRNRQT